MLYYYNEIKRNNMTLSIDNVVLDASVSGPNRAETLMNRANQLHLASESVDQPCAGAGVSEKLEAPDDPVLGQ